MRQQNRETNRVTRQDVAARLRQEYPGAHISYPVVTDGRQRRSEILIEGAKATSAIYRREETLLLLMIYFNRLLATGERTGKAQWWNDRRAMAMNREADRYSRARRVRSTVASSAHERRMQGSSMAGLAAHAA